MVGMRFSIDAVFVGRDRRVVKVAPLLRPWALAVGDRRGVDVLELPPGAIALSGTQVGDDVTYG